MILEVKPPEGTLLTTTCLLYITGPDDSSSTAPTPQTGKIFNLSLEAPMYEVLRGC